MHSLLHSQVGAETAAKLKEQTEQLERVNADLDKIDTNIARARRQLRVFMRRMMTDKIILGFLFLIVIGIVVVIILRFGIVAFCLQRLFLLWALVSNQAFTCPGLVRHPAHLSPCITCSLTNKKTAKKTNTGEDINPAF
jgi:hypothetical protein